MDLGILKSAVSRVEADGQFKDLMVGLSTQVLTPEAELERFVARFVERCVFAGVDRAALANTLVITGALMRSAIEGREAAATAMRAVAAGIYTDDSL